MAYDYHMGTEAAANHQAPLFANPADPSKDAKTFYTDYAVKLYLAGGVPADKLVIGVPFYGRGSITANKEDDGLYKPATGKLPKGTWEDGVFDYTDVVKNYLPKSKAGYDETAQAAYCYDSATGIFISYDNPKSIAAKCDYVNQNNLGGIMFWELSGDRDQDLLNVMFDKFGGKAK
jgi:chitinase